MNKKAKLALISALFLVCVLLIALAIARPTRGPKPECNDKIDNDGDGNTDMADSGCSNPQDNDETDCGDSVCEGGETSGSCPADCGYPDSCSDTDSGIYPNTFGTTSGYYNNISYSDDDYCVDSGNIMEYYCSGDYEQSTQLSCGTDYYGSPYCSSGDTIYKDYIDYFCSSGACDYTQTPEFQEDCDDNDGYGDFYCVNDIIKKDYFDYYCNGGSCNHTQTPETVQDCSVFDDYGPNYCMNSTTVYRDFFDFTCLFGGCNSTAIPEYVETCTEMEVCSDGECVIPDSCDDTDGGIDYEVKGTIYGYQNEFPYNYTDLCMIGDRLFEGYCDGDRLDILNVSCSLMNYSGCSDGVCY